MTWNNGIWVNPKERREHKWFRVLHTPVEDLPRVIRQAWRAFVNEIKNGRK